MNIHTSRRIIAIAGTMLALVGSISCHSPTSSSSGVGLGGSGIGTGFGGPPRFASFSLNPDIPDPIRIGESVLVTLTPTGDDARAGYQVLWLSAGHEFATWTFPATRCEHNNCAILTPVATTSDDPASPTYSVLLSMQVCQVGETAFCPSRGFFRRVVK